MEKESELRVIEIGDGNTRTINIDLNGEFPLVIGRGPDADVQIGILGKRIFIKDRLGNDVTISQCISKIQATIHRYDNGELRIHDGNGHPSAGGIRIFGQDEPIKRPVPLSPGAHIELMPRTKGYYCWLEWADNSNGNNEPTLGFNRWNKSLLEDDKRVLEGEKQELIERVRSVEIVNEAQDLKIKLTQQKIDRIKLLGTIAVAAILISLGIDIEQLDTILQIIAALSFGGAVWTSAEKPKAS